MYHNTVAGARTRRSLNSQTRFIEEECLRFPADTLRKDCGGHRGFQLRLSEGALSINSAGTSAGGRKGLGQRGYRTARDAHSLAAPSGTGRGFEKRYGDQTGARHRHDALFQ